LDEAKADKTDNLKGNLMADLMGSLKEYCLADMLAWWLAMSQVELKGSQLGLLLAAVTVDSSDCCLADELAIQSAYSLVEY